MHINTYYLLALSFLLFAAEASAQVSCEKPPFKAKEGQVLAIGTGITRDSAIDNAILNANLQTSDSQVESQFIQTQTDNQSSYQSNSQIRSNNDSQQGLIDQKTFRCNKQYISYRLVDNQSLFIRVSQVLAGKNIKLTGPSYLVNSPLLAKFSQKQAKNTLNVSLTATHNNNYLLALGENIIPINKSQLWDLISMPPQSTDIQSFRDIIDSENTTNSPTLLKASALDLIHNEQVVIQLQSDPNQLTRLYMCTQEGLCNILQSELKNSQHLTLLSTRTTNNINTRNNYVFAVNTKLLNHIQLLSEPSALPNLFLSLIEIVSNNPQQSDWLNIESVRNF